VKGQSPFILAARSAEEASSYGEEVVVEGVVVDGGVLGVSADHGEACEDDLDGDGIGEAWFGADEDRLHFGFEVVDSAGLLGSLDDALDSGVAAEETEEGAVADDELDEALEGVVDLGASASFGSRFVEDLVELADGGADDGFDDLVFCFEVVIDGGFGDAEVVGDHLYRGAFHPVLAEELQGGVE